MRSLSQNYSGSPFLKLTYFVCEFITAVPPNDIAVVYVGEYICIEVKFPSRYYRYIKVSLYAFKQV